MNFGEKLKQLRQERAWSQPELADAIGIEQSYLSKLENDKSAPSPDMLNRILEAFDIDIDTLLEGMDESEIRNHLRSIPLVSGHLLAQKENAQRRRRQWIITSSLLCVIGLATMTLGIGNMANPEVIYDYESAEIVPNGGNNETFESLQSFLQREFASTYADLMERALNQTELEIASNNEFEKLKYQYSTLVTPAFHHSYTYEGNGFISVTTDEQDLINLEATGQLNGGTRMFALSNTRSELRDDWIGINVGGVFLFALGIFGFITERRLFSKTS